MSSLICWHFNHYEIFASSNFPCFKVYFFRKYFLYLLFVWHITVPSFHFVIYLNLCIWNISSVDSIWLGLAFFLSCMKSVLWVFVSLIFKDKQSSWINDNQVSTCLLFVSYVIFPSFVPFSLNSHTLKRYSPAGIEEKSATFWEDKMIRTGYSF